MANCRPNLAAIATAAGAVHHAGLTLNRYVPALDPQPKRALLERVAQSGLPDTYGKIFGRWQRILQSRPGCVSFFAETAGPLAVGLGEESPIEVGLTLQHTYGTPVIPGSALKGLCLSAARGSGPSAPDTDQLRVLFGDTTFGGCVTFWDAWLEAGQKRPLKLDTVTVHHPDYYQGKAVWPTDFDDPNPIPFVVVTPGTRFLFAVEAPEEAWTAYAVELLKWALEHRGVGGKTSAGYGRFTAFQMPAQEETWEACRLQQIAGGSVTITHARGQIVRSRRQWSDLSIDLTEGLKGLLREGTLLADVQVQLLTDGPHFRRIHRILPQAPPPEALASESVRDFLEWLGADVRTESEFRERRAAFPGLGDELFLVEGGEVMLSSEGDTFLARLRAETSSP